MRVLIQTTVSGARGLRVTNRVNEGTPQAIADALVAIDLDPAFEHLVELRITPIRAEWPVSWR